MIMPSIDDGYVQLL